MAKSYDQIQQIAGGSQLSQENTLSQSCLKVFNLLWRCAPTGVSDL